MTDKNEGVGKDAGPSADSAGPKRPHATLDLKATEIKDETPRDPSKPAAEAAAAAGAAASASKSKNGATGTAGKGTASAPAPRPAAASSKAVAFFTHLAAAVIGGTFVLAGNQMLSTQPIGDQLDAAALKVRASEIEDRVAALENAPKPVPADPALAERVNETADRVAKLEEVSRAVAGFEEAQQKLAAETKELADTVARQGSDTTVRDRVQKLEERLAMLAAADTGPDGARLPQLAAITGKIADVEGSLTGQIAAVRKSVPADISDRLAAVVDASEAAKSATERFERELSTLKTDNARASQRIDTVKADTDRLTAALETVSDETRKLAANMAELKSSVGAELKGVAKPGDISAAITPLSGKVASLEQGLKAVVKSEEDRNANAERIVLSLELASLKRAVDGGRPYASELELVRKSAGGTIDLAALDRYKDTGVASLSDLERGFRPVMNAVVDASAEPVDGSVIERLIAGAKSVVRVRKVSHTDTDRSAEAIVSRMEEALKDGRLGDVIEEAKAIPPQASGALDDWLQAVKARYAVDQAIAGVEAELKASLTAAAPAADAPKPPANERN